MSFVVDSVQRRGVALGIASPVGFVAKFETADNVLEANPDIEPGSVVEATGICVLDMENWASLNHFFVSVRRGGSAASLLH